MASLKSPALTCVGAPERTRFNRCTSAAANAADGASSAAVASIEKIADRRRDNGTSPEEAAGPRSGVNPVVAGQHSGEAFCPQPLGTVGALRSGVRPPLEIPRPRWAAGRL